MLGVKSPRDFGSALVFLFIGLSGLYFGSDLTYGTAGRMGPGYFPFLLSILIVAIGVVVGIRSLTIEGPPVDAPKFRPLAMVMLCIIVFGYGIDYIGLALSSIVLTFIAAYARRNVSIVETAIFAVILSVGTVLIFVYGLGQPLPAWWGDY
jgi:hypothetical protein